MSRSVMGGVNELLLPAEWEEETARRIARETVMSAVRIQAISSRKQAVREGFREGHDAGRIHQHRAILRAHVMLYRSIVPARWWKVFHAAFIRAGINRVNKRLEYGEGT